MSRFDQRFENHSVHTTLNQMNSLIKEILELQNSSDSIIELQRIEQVGTFTQGVLSNCEPSLVVTSFLDNVNTYLNQVDNYLRNYRNDRNIGHLQNANNSIDSVLQNIASLTIPTTPNDFEGIRKSIVTFRQSIAQHLRHTEEEFNRIAAAKRELENALTQVSSTVENQKSRLDNAIAEYQNQFSQAEVARREQFAQAEAERQDRFVTLEGEWGNIVDSNEADRIEIFMENEGERSKSFTELAESIKDGYNQSLNLFSTKRAELEEEFVLSAKAYLEQMEDYKNQAARNLNMISISSMAGGYQAVANQERGSRKLWRIVTMASMGALAVASIWSFTHPFDQGTIWTELSRRLFIAGTFATLAGYSARQAKIHLDAERRYRRLELELTALNPYLAELEDDKRKAVIEEMAGVFFGQKENEIENEEGKKSTEPTKELSANIIELGKLVENIKGIIQK